MLHGIYFIVGKLILPACYLTTECEYERLYQPSERLLYIGKKNQWLILAQLLER